MNSVAKRVMGAGNKVAAWLYRRTDGRMGGSAKGTPVLLLTVNGRKTGKPHSVPVGYFEHGDGYVVAASAGGAKAEPQWIQNLRAAGQAHIQIREHEYDVDARIPDGPERDDLWQNVVVANAPHFAGYEEKSGRKIAVALLTGHS
jgi:deazaflavin-dependent oxidoreductase (nitroreductase family)